MFFWDGWVNDAMKLSYLMLFNHSHSLILRNWVAISLTVVKVKLYILLKPIPRLFDRGWALKAYENTEHCDWVNRGVRQWESLVFFASIKNLNNNLCTTNISIVKCLPSNPNFYKDFLFYKQVLSHIINRMGK